MLILERTCRDQLLKLVELDRVGRELEKMGS